jgi:hypothetical protein
MIVKSPLCGEGFLLLVDAAAKCAAFGRNDVGFDGIVRCRQEQLQQQIPAG